jgi:hypothetical protein
VSGRINETAHRRDAVESPNTAAARSLSPIPTKRQYPPKAAAIATDSVAHSDTYPSRTAARCAVRVVPFSGRQQRRQLRKTPGRKDDNFDLGYCRPIDDNRAIQPVIALYVNIPGRRHIRGVTYAPLNQQGFSVRANQRRRRETSFAQPCIEKRAYFVRKRNT